MKKFIFFISITLSLLLNSNMAILLGLEADKLTASSLLLFLFLLYELFNKNITFNNNNKPEILLLTAGFIVLFVGYISGRSFLKHVVAFLFIPYTLSAYLSSKKCVYQVILKYAIYCVLFIEIIMVIYERVTLSLLLTPEGQYSMINANRDVWSFRSSGIYGHPLTAALILSVINVFIIYSTLNIKTRVFFFFFIMVGLFCLNERFNILVTLVSSFPFLYKPLKHGSPLFRIIGGMTFLLICYYSFQGLAESDWGGRLFHFEEGFNDESSKQRLDAYYAFEYLDRDVLLWGFGEKKMELKNLTYVENGYINILLQYGLILGIPLLILLLYYLYKKLSIYKWQYALLIAIVFLGVGFTNPQLSNPLQWLFWIVSYYAFCPSVYNLHSRCQK